MTNKSSMHQRIMQDRFKVDQEETRRQREMLFGSRGGMGMRAAHRSGQDQYAQQNAAMLEEQNNQHIEDLENKVNTLRDITYGIQGEVRDSNNILDGLGSQFDKALPMLKGTIGKLNHMIKTKQGKHMWYMMAFVIFVFFLLYFMSGSSSSSAASPVEILDQASDAAKAANAAAPQVSNPVHS